MGETGNVSAGDGETGRRAGVSAKVGLYTPPEPGFPAPPLPEDVIPHEFFQLPPIN